MAAEQVRAELAADLGALQRVFLVGALGFDLEGAHTAQLFAQVAFGRGADGVKVFFAAGGAAELDDAEHTQHAAERFVGIKVLLLRFNEHGALGGPDLERAEVLETAADAFGKPGFELAAVEALEGHFALIGQDDLFHESSFQKTV